MKQLLFSFAILFILFSCASSRKPKSVQDTHTNTTAIENNSGLRNLNSHFSGKNSSEVNHILKDAEKYLGTPYQYAGITPSGFDCSGLVCKVFDENKIKLPRRSEDQSKQGMAIEIKNVQPGDLIFFATNGGTKVSHVGIAHGVGSKGEVTFIHSSTSKGVIISSLNQKYWNKAFLFARRVL